MAPEDPISELWEKLTKDARAVVEESLAIERRYLHMGKPRGVIDDLTDAVEKRVSA